MGEIDTKTFSFLGKKRRLTFIECNNDINTMIDLAKVADLVSEEFYLFDETQWVLFIKIDGVKKINKFHFLYRFKSQCW